jgi:hypothetical protein
VSRLYTVAEANRTLPYVRTIVAEIRERYRSIQEKGRRHQAVASQERETLKAEIRAEAERIHSCMEELEEIGAELKDYEMGLIDFPAELEGRRILLCWKYGEEDVGFWHEEREGYRGRQPVPADEPAWPRSGAVRTAPPRAGRG